MKSLQIVISFLFALNNFTQITLGKTIRKQLNKMLFSIRDGRYMGMPLIRTSSLTCHTAVTTLRNQALS